MIKLISDGFILVHEDDISKVERSFSMDKSSGRIRIIDTDLTNNQIVYDTRCKVTDLISIHDIDKFIDHDNQDE